MFRHKNGEAEHETGLPLVADAMVTRPKTLGLQTTVDQVRVLFEDDHVHIALVVDLEGRLVTTIERSDIAPEVDGSALAAGVGTRAGRTIHPGRPLSEATSDLLSRGRRRLAVTDDRNHLLGLLCLKRSGLGYCSDNGVLARAKERAKTSASSTALAAAARINPVATEPFGKCLIPHEMHGECSSACRVGHLIE